MDVKAVVEKCRSHFGNNLYSGNCGMFAVALGTFLQEHGVDSQVVIFSDYEGDEPSCAADLMDYDPCVYHAALSVNDKLYDGDGEVPASHIREWIEEEYTDKDPSVHKMPLSSRGMKALMRNNTSWYIGCDFFYDFIKKHH